MQIYSKSQTNHKKYFFISQPILIWFAVSGRTRLGTLNYTEFEILLHWLIMVIYAKLLLPHFLTDFHYVFI